jgi:hypothetical protein
MPQFLNSTPLLRSSHPGRLASRNSTDPLPFLLNHLRLPTQETPSVLTITNSLFQTVLLITPRHEPHSKHSSITFFHCYRGVFTSPLCRAIAQAVSHLLSTAAARVRDQGRSCGICGGQSGTGEGLLRVLRFPLPIFIPPTAPRLSFIIRGWYNRLFSGRHTKCTQSHPTPRNKKELPRRWIETVVLLLLRACTFLREPNYRSCLTMNYSGFQASCHNIQHNILA